MLYQIEIRRTLEWGGTFEADDEEDAKDQAYQAYEPRDAVLVDEQVIVKPLNED